MPLYEYECQRCGQRSEELQRFDDPPLTECPSCGGRYRRLLSAPAFQFKGSGWYVTDYARKKTDAKGEPKEKAEAGDKAEKAEKKEKKEGKAESGGAGDAPKAGGEKPAAG